MSIMEHQILKIAQVNLQMLEKTESELSIEKEQREVCPINNSNYSCYLLTYKI